MSHGPQFLVKHTSNTSLLHRSPRSASACSEPRSRPHRRCQAQGEGLPPRLPARWKGFLALDRVYLRPLAWGVCAVLVFPGTQARHGLLCRYRSGASVAQRVVSATRRVLLPASVPRRSRVRPSFCPADWRCCSTTPASAPSGRQCTRVAGGPRCQLGRLIASIKDGSDTTSR